MQFLVIYYGYSLKKPKRVWIEGYGVYQVKDVIHKRHKHRIDILLHPKDNKLIYKKHIKIKVLK